MKKRNAHSAQTNLEAISRTYICKIRPRSQAEINWFVRQPSPDAAIEKAALAINSRAKHYPR